MYVKTTTRQGKVGPVGYLHLAHNEWDAGRGRSVPRILYSFGREDELDKDAVRRFVASLGPVTRSRLRPSPGTWRSTWSGQRSLAQADHP
ncbi:MAG TPA: hypothetical protein VF070_14005 [Streptosporangiaceae bacterium]